MDGRTCLVSVMTVNGRLLQGQDWRPHHLRSAGPFTGDAHAHADGADGDIVVENWRKDVEAFSEAGKQNDMGRNEVQGAWLCCPTLFSIRLMSRSGTRLLAALLNLPIHNAWNHRREFKRDSELAPVRSP